MKRHNTIIYICLFIILAFGSFIRYEYNSNIFVREPLVGDAMEYYIYGYNLYKNEVFSKTIPDGKNEIKPDSFRSPGYPFLIALTNFIVDKYTGIENPIFSKLRYKAIIYMQVVMSIITILLAFLLARFYLPDYWALIAALFTALSPHLVTMSGYVLSETSTAFFILLSLYFFQRGIVFRKTIDFIISGLFFGCTYLINESLIILPILLFLGYFVYLKLMKRSEINKIFLKSIMCFIIIFMIFPISWNIRNYISIKGSLLTSGSRALYALSYGTYPDFKYKTEQYRYFPQFEDPQQPEYRKSLENFINIFSDRFKEDPYKYITWYLLKKPFYFWNWNLLEGQGDIYVYYILPDTSIFISTIYGYSIKMIMLLFHPFILLFTALGGIFLIINYKKIGEYIGFVKIPSLILILIIYVTVIYTIFSSLPRLSIPYRPELYIFSLWSIWYIVERLKFWGISRISN